MSTYAIAAKLKYKDLPENVLDNVGRILSAAGEPVGVEYDYRHKTFDMFYNEDRTKYIIVFFSGRIPIRNREITEDLNDIIDVIRGYRE